MAKTYRVIPALTAQDIKRFEKFVDRSPGQGPNGDCHQWQGFRNPKAGHGTFGLHDRAYLAHRVAYLIYHGEIDPTLQILHKCGNGACVRKEHLRQGDQSENSFDGWRFRRENIAYTPDPDHVPIGRRKPQTVEERFWSFVDKTPGQGPNGDCWIWTAGKRKGYGAFNRRKGEMWDAHRFSYYLAHGRINKSKVLLHICDNRACVNPAHLKQGTQADNLRDMRDKGRDARGIKHGSKTHPESVVRGEQVINAKLTEDQVREIRRLADSGVSHGDIAKQYGMSRAAISMIAERKRWKHVV